MRNWLVILVVSLSSVARAQVCVKDTECPDDLLCVAGRCGDGNTAPTLPALSRPLPERPRGWARGAGISAVILSSAVFALGISSEVTRAKIVPSVPLGVSAILLFTADVPIAAAGGAATRRLTGVPGSPGLRAAGWVLYSASLALAFVPLGYGIVGKTPPAGLIASATSGGFASGMMFAIDDFVTARQAEDAAPRATMVSYGTRF